MRARSDKAARTEEVLDVMLDFLGMTATEATDRPTRVAALFDACEAQRRYERRRGPSPICPNAVKRLEPLRVWAGRITADRAAVA